MVSVIGYATFVNPALVAEKGVKGPYDLVRVLGQRFFGAADPSLAGRTLEDVLDASGRLTVRDIGAMTVDPDCTGRYYNAVAYNEVTEDALAELERIEVTANFHRRQIDRMKITTFPDGERWDNGGEPVYIYVAKPSIEVPGLGVVRIVRSNVKPNPAYLQRCLDAAAVHGPRFLREYVTTTFLANRLTPVA